MQQRVQLLPFLTVHRAATVVAGRSIFIIVNCKSVFVKARKQSHSCMGERILFKLEAGQWPMPLKNTEKKTTINQLQSNLRTSGNIIV
jgi:hypothetical protein